MDDYITTVILLAGLLIATNRKPIATFNEWLKFRIKTIYKQWKNERNNNTNRRSREI